MKKVLTKISVAIFLVSALVPFLSRAQQETPLTPAECFDYYKFGSVTVDINPAVKQVAAGAQLRFYLTVTNNNDSPIVDGSAYIKIVREQTNPTSAKKNGGLVVDQFFAKEKISLDAKETKNFELLWNVPAWVPEGAYHALSYFQSAKKLDLAGFSFTDDVAGGEADFLIKSEFKKSVELDKNNVRLNGKVRLFMTSIPQFSKDELITVQAPILNPTKEKQEASVTYDLYFWDGLSDSRKLDTKNEKVSLTPGETKTLNYQIVDNHYSVYYLVVKSQWHDFSSILDIRTIRKDIDWPKVDFIGMTSFPIKKGEANTIFACIHNAIPGPFDAVNSSGTVKTATVKLELSLLDNEKNLIQKYVYNGGVGGNITGLKADLTPAGSYDRFSVKASLFDEGNKLVDEVTLKYNCKDINQSKCLQATTLPPTGATSTTSTGLGIDLLYVYIAGGVIVLGIIAVIIIKRRKKNNIPPPMDQGGLGQSISQSAGPTPTIPTGGAAALVFLLVMGLGVFLGTTTAEAKSRTVFVGITGDYRNIDLLAPYNEQFSVADFITYNAKVTDENGIELNDGDIVYVGKKITFSYDPNDFLLDGSVTARWVTYGFCNPAFHLGIVSSYGHWKSGGGYPYANQKTCREVEKWAVLTELGYPNISLYLPFSVSTPTITFNTSRAEAAGILGECLTTGSQRTCKVTGEGIIWDGVVFGQSDLGHYWNQLDTTTGVCTYLGELFMRWGTRSVSGAKINFFLNAKKVPQIPTPISPPVITGQTVGKPEERYVFTAQSPVNEAAGNEYRYLFDWDGDEIAPYAPTAYVPAGNAGSASFGWSSIGSKAFKVKTQDNNGNESPWSSHTIVISAAPTCTPSQSWTSCTASCGGGTRSLVDTDTSCGTSIIKTEACNTQSCGRSGGGNIKEVNPGGP